MRNSLKKWEIALMISFALTLCFGGYLERTQEELAGSMIRLHVLANSDREEDQKLKLMVRDSVLREAEKIYPRGADLETAREALKQALPRLEQAGEQTVHEMGYHYPVTAQLEETWFPTKDYESFRLPAGKYEALRILIGEGAGQNWWCVAFPPICLGAASRPLEETVEAGYFSPEQVRLMQETDQSYVFKFKSLELLGKLRELLDKNC